jgi:peptidoglycan hydrolase CwlO-like protein
MNKLDNLNSTAFSLVERIKYAVQTDDLLDDVEECARENERLELHVQELESKVETLQEKTDEQTEIINEQKETIKQMRKALDDLKDINDKLYQIPSFEACTKAEADIIEEALTELNEIASAEYD